MEAPTVWQRRVWATTLIALLWTVIGCSGPKTEHPQPAPSASATAAAAALPAASLPDGQRIELELAITPEEISQGLMYRPSLEEERGMLFLFDHERRPSFWMKNTLIPLDLVFVGSSGTVVDVIADAQPCAADPCPQYVPTSPARAVLELKAGTAGRHGVVIGSELRFERVPGFPVTP